MKSERVLHAVLLVSVAAFCLALYSSLHENIVNAGDSAPDFSITTDSGKTVSKTEFGGKLLLLNFWATWCPPCIEEIPGLNEMAQTLGPKGLVILGVSVDKDADIYKKFLERNPLA